MDLPLILLKLFGISGKKAVTKELQQLHDMETYIPMDPKKLSRIDRFKALSALMFLVEKRDGSIKARKCTVGSKQRTWEGYKKEDGASPTVATDSVIVTSVIEAHED